MTVSAWVYLFIYLFTSLLRLLLANGSHAESENMLRVWTSVNRELSEYHIPLTNAVLE